MGLSKDFLKTTHQQINNIFSFKMKLLYLIFGTLCFQLCEVDVEGKQHLLLWLTISAASSLYFGAKLYLGIAQTGCWPTHIDSNAFLGEMIKQTVLTKTQDQLLSLRFK